MPPRDQDSEPPSDREQKLAQALRANLRRRKAGDRTPVEEPATRKSSHDD
jgi:hypothetical protein